MSRAGLFLSSSSMFCVMPVAFPPYLRMRFQRDWKYSAA